MLELADGVVRRGHDVVSAVRTATKGASWFKRLSSNAFYFVFNRLSDVQLTPGAADYMLLSRQAYEVLRAMPERRRFLRGLIAWTGFAVANNFQAINALGLSPLGYA